MKFVDPRFRPSSFQSVPEIPFSLVYEPSGLIFLGGGIPCLRQGALRDVSSQTLADLVSSSLPHSAVYREAGVP